MIQHALVAFGYDVTLAANGRESLERFDPQRIRLVLTELIMPDIEGVERITALRRRSPRIKVIAMSGGGHPGQALPAGRIARRPRGGVRR